MKNSEKLLIAALVVMTVASGGLAMARRGGPNGGPTRDSRRDAPPNKSREVTIVSTGSTADVQAIQTAVDDPAVDVVKLSGTFEFGVDGGVWITRAGVTVTGEGKDRPVINGGGAFRTVYINYGGTETWERHHRYVFGINAPGVTIRGLEFRNFDTEAIFVLGGSPDPRPVVIDDNVMSTENIAGMEELMSAAVGSHYTGGWPMRISNNKMTGSTGGIVASWSGYYLNESGQDTYGGSPLDIVNNEITTNVPPDQLVDGILVLGWNTFESIHPDPEWGDNGPVLITGNTVNYNDSPATSWGGLAIGIGRSAMGLNHCLVANNTITGHGMAGIVKYSYGHDNQIVGNDLSGFAAWDGQIWVFAADTLVSKNILGLANEFEGYTSGIWVFATLVHPGLCPMPVPLENVMILNNDYTHISDASGSSAAGIWVASNADWCYEWDEAGDCTEAGQGQGNEVRNNTIVEPAKSWGVKPADLAETLANQVYLQPSNDGVGPQMVHDNKIFGLNATKKDVAQAVKDAKKMTEVLKEMHKRMFKIRPAGFTPKLRK